MSGAHHFHSSILREYDIRGTYGRTLFDADAFAIGRVFAGEVLAAGGRCVAVGYDGRLSSPALEAALVGGLCEGGVDVRRIGLGPTPMLYFAEASTEEVQGGIQITGSHNPPDHNGFKIVLGGRPFFGQDIVRLGQMAAMEQPEIGRKGVDQRVRVDGLYVERLLGAFEGLELAELAGLRIGWDTGNGAVGPVLGEVLRRLPGEHCVLFAEVDGHFPNHHPDPTDEGNLADLRNLVASRRLDFGVAFDGDGDRLGVVDAAGRIIWGDELLAIAAEEVLSAHPGSVVVGDVKMSQLVFQRIAELGGQGVMWKSGHSHIKSKMKATGALLGGETTGHLFFADRWYGFDDALYGALRLIAACVRSGRSMADWRDALPRLHTTPELFVPAADERKFGVIAEVAGRLEAEGAQPCTIDGLRVDTEDGWWLLRASNTQAMLTARAESPTAEGLTRLLAEIERHLGRSGLSLAQ